MATFSGEEINDAKRRVQEMHERARQYVQETAPPSSEPPVKEPEPPPANTFDELFRGEDSALLLALILILSHEKADNHLIMALLYILL